MKRLLLVGVVLLGILVDPWGIPPVFAQGPFSAQIVRALQAYGFSSPQVWTGLFVGTDQLCLDKTNLDTCLARDAAGTLALKRGANAQAFRIYNDATTYSTLGARTTLTGGTVTANAPVLALTQTWNNAGVTFTGMTFDATDTASAAGSLLADWRVGGASKFALTKAGNAWLVNGTAAAPSMSFASDPDTGIYLLGANSLGTVTGGALRYNIDNGAAYLWTIPLVLVGPDATASTYVRTDASNNLLVHQTEKTPAAPSAALAGAGAGNVDNGTHVYKETCITPGGETDASPASGAVTVVDKTVNGKVTVTLVACSPIATGRNLYRSKAGTATPLYLVAVSPVVGDGATTATYTDNIADAALQAGTTPTANTAIDTRWVLKNDGSIAFGGVTASYPALMRDGLSLVSIAANGSTWAGLESSWLYPSNAVITAATGPGITTIVTGTVQGSIVREVAVAKEAFVCAGVTCDVTISTLPAKTQVTAVYADLTQTFACAAVCTTATLSFTLGSSAGGTDLLVSFDADAALLQRGLVDADLGTGINRANAVQGGKIFSWSATTPVSLRLTSGTGNIGNGAVTNLSQGTLVLYLVTTRLP